MKIECMANVVDVSSKVTKAVLFDKSSSLATTVGVTKVITIIATNLVTISLA
jgi:hypothetical protein